MRRFLLVLVIGSALAGCGSGATSKATAPASPTASVESTPSVKPAGNPAKAYVAAAARSNKVLGEAQSDLNAAIAQYQAAKLTDAAFFDRIHGNYKKVAEADDAFIADLAAIHFPDLVHPAVDDLVKQVGAHRDACKELSTIMDTLAYGAAVTRETDAAGTVHTSANSVRTGLALPAAPSAGGGLGVGSR